jgi:hypothetical protein
MQVRKILVSIAFALLLSGCADAPPVSKFPDMTFANVQGVSLDVAKIDVIDNYHPPMKTPNMEHLFPTSPAAATKLLVQKELLASGASKILRVMIDDASVVSETLPTTKGFWGALEREPEYRLKAKVFLRFELANEAAPDIIIGHAEVIAKRNKVVLEDMTPAERDRAYFDLTEDLMGDVRDGLATVVKNTFGK